MSHSKTEIVGFRQQHPHTAGSITMEDSTWDQFRLESSSFQAGSHRRARSSDDRNRGSFQISSSIDSSDSLPRTRRSNASKGINETLMNAIWTKTSNSNSSNNNNNDNNAKRSRRGRVGKILHQEKQEGIRLGRISREGKFVPASIAA